VSKPLDPPISQIELKLGFKDFESVLVLLFGDRAQFYSRVVWTPACSPGPPNRPLCPLNKGQTGVDCLPMIILTYLVHVGCHLDCHVVAQVGADV
jgi:hypothetical protein